MRWLDGDDGSGSRIVGTRLLRLKPGAAQTYNIPAPAAVRLEDLQRKDLRAELTLRLVRRDLHVESIELLTFPQMRRRASAAGASTR